MAAPVRELNATGPACLGRAFAIKAVASSAYALRLHRSVLLNNKMVVRAVGLEPTRAKAQRIFIPSTAFAAA